MRVLAFAGGHCCLSSIHCVLAAGCRGRAYQILQLSFQRYGVNFEKLRGIPRLSSQRNGMTSPQDRAAEELRTRDDAVTPTRDPLNR